ncbi:scopoletin glucosyltransferase-like [Primulina eburnea]|uniref:scopoletin glucosyltransferase-like n=1 Tax=Primulina eburnea TaxID=1245227 RepID=UPI003C6C8097
MGQLRAFFFPFWAQGHMIPLLEMAKLFTSRGVKSTIISTPFFVEPLKETFTQESGIDIGLKIIKFPHPGSGLPDHVVSLELANTDELVSQFGKAMAMMQEPFEELIHEFKPDFIVSDMFFPWTVDSAAKFDIPRLVFHGTSCLALCVGEQMQRHKPFKNVSSDSESFFVPDLPHRLEFLRTQMCQADLEEHESDFGRLLKQVRESDRSLTLTRRSYGVLVNSFYELEPAYSDHYRTVLGRRSWNIGPLFLCDSGNNEGRGHRGKKSAVDADKWKSWLDSKEPDSVDYACFGSQTSFTHAQLHEIGIGLEASGQDFVWVLRKCVNQEDEIEDWMPEGFEERTKDKGLIIRGWAPQLPILNHPAIGTFVRHCGWNSTLEGICAGIPMVTWLLSAEQFFNEKLVTDVLKTGVSVGNKIWRKVGSEGVASASVSMAVRRVMIGEEAEEIRCRAKEWKEMARKAVGEGGSSYNDLSALIDELSKQLTDVEI